MFIYPTLFYGFNEIPASIFVEIAKSSLKFLYGTYKGPKIVKNTLERKTKLEDWHSWIFLVIAKLQESRQWGISLRTEQNRRTYTKSDEVLTTSSLRYHDNVNPALDLLPELCNHQQLLEHFHYPKRKLHTISNSSPFDPTSFLTTLSNH